MQRTSEQLEIIDSARKSIDKAIEDDGPYSHNVVGASLRHVASKVSIRAANDLVDEFALDDLFGISKLPCPPDQVIEATL